MIKKNKKSDCAGKSVKTAAAKPKRHRKTMDEEFAEIKEKFNLLTALPPDMLDEVLAESTERERSVFCLMTGYQYRGQSKLDVLKGLGMDMDFVGKTIAKAKRKVMSNPVKKSAKKSKSK